MGTRAQVFGFFGVPHPYPRESPYTSLPGDVGTVGTRRGQDGWKKKGEETGERLEVVREIRTEKRLLVLH